MRNNANIAVIIPVLNEQAAIANVISAVPDWVDDIIVVDNGSTDNTADLAGKCGGRVISEPIRGYGSACLAGIEALDGPDIVVFLDGDFSDHPDQMSRLVDPIVGDDADMVIGSRVLGHRQPGALTPQARFGNWLACNLIRIFWRTKYTDLGPFRAIRYSSLKQLQMCDRDYGWTVEMQVKAAQLGLRTREVPVSYRRRIGKSKISGTLKGIIGAGTKILGTIFLFAITDRITTAGRSRSGEKLIIFTRYPQPGKTKTRLIPLLGPDRAAELQRSMTVQTLYLARNFARRRALSIEVHFEGGDADAMQQWLGPDLVYKPQHTGDLGERMAGAFQDAFENAAKRVVILGTDCPQITWQLLQAAFDATKRNDLVLGPASDGGYYLIGLAKAGSSRAIPKLFEGVDWGTDRVLRQTTKLAKNADISIKFLKTLDDVDRPEDLHVWNRASENAYQPSQPARISIIIPTHNEAHHIAAALASAQAGANVELIVVDAGSTDSTVQIARSFGARVINSFHPRARQMNIGAEAATGEILMFLHADSRLPCRFDDYVRRTLAEPGTTAGAFELRIEGGSPGLRLIEKLANWRANRLAMPYGDQAMFLKADLFNRLGRFPDLPIMEDFELARRLRRCGRTKILPLPVLTSGRRWLACGTLRATLINQLIIAGFYLGLSACRLERWYARSGKPQGP